MEPVGRHAIVSDTVRFEIRIENTGETTITDLYLRDEYDPECLRFLSSTIPTSAVDPDIGIVAYNNIEDLWGGSIPPGSDPIIFYMRFHAEGYCQPAENCMVMVEAGDDCGQSIEFLEDCAEVYIDPVPCTEAITNGGFETGDLLGWFSNATSMELWPSVQSDDVHGGNYAAQLGTCGGHAGPHYMPAGESAIAQFFHVPENVDYAPLTFWYKMVTDDWDVDYDWFTVQYWAIPTGGGAAIATTIVPRICENTDWVQVGPIDLTHMRGRDVAVQFTVHQDGNFGCTTAYIDDVELCADIEGGNDPEPGPTPEGSCWKQGNYTDYAPNGVPDFDMRQADWQNPSDQWNYDAPAAFANSLWWMDSRFEQELAPTVVPPPEISDHYGLLEAYGAWDDHAEENVQPFVEDLADYLGTNADGTTPADAYGGVLDYLEDQGLDDQYTVTWRPSPSLDWIRSEVLRCEDVMLLLGFWENQAGEWKRLGGHWVTAPGVGCEHEPIIGLSDPWFDRAEYGWPGEWRPSFSAHPHPPEPPDTVHNDAAYLSHDLYTVFRSGDGDALARYAPEYEEIENFFGLNVPPPHETAQALEYMDGEISTRIEDAIAVSPYTDTVVLRLDPVLNHVLEGSVFEGELMVDSGDQLINSVSVHLNFNRNKLRIVNEAGNATGQIDFVASALESAKPSGSFTVATIRFKVLKNTRMTRIRFSAVEPRFTRVAVDGEYPSLRYVAAQVNVNMLKLNLPLVFKP